MTNNFLRGWHVTFPWFKTLNKIPIEKNQNKLLIWKIINYKYDFSLDKSFFSSV